MIIISVGENIRKARINKGITQEQLAESSGISLNFVSKIERQKRQNLTVKTLSAIASALNVSVSELLNEPNNSKAIRINVESLYRELYNLPSDQAEKLTKAFLEIIESIKK